MIEGDILMRNPDEIYDFTGFGQAIKEAREKRGWTREKLAQEVDLAPRYIMSIENKGQHPSLQVLYNLATLFNISVDQFFFPDTGIDKSTRRRQLDASLDELDEKDYLVLQGTADALRKAKAE